MKNIFLRYTFLLVILVNIGCDKEIVEPEVKTGSIGLPAVMMGKRSDAACTAAYYYYENQKVNLGTVLTDKIIIGFPTGYTLEQKSAFVAQYKFLKGIESEYNTGSADATIVLLQDNLTCQNVAEILAYLEQQAVVQYVGPFYNSQDGSAKLGIANQFIVTLGAGTVVSDIEPLIRKTNTKMVEHLGDNLYIFSADKNSAGNSLEMANAFAEHSKIDAAEPDFLYSYSASYTSTGL